MQIHVNTVSINNDAVVADERPNIDSSDHDKVNEGLHYSITDTPPWYLCALLGLQVTVEREDPSPNCTGQVINNGRLRVLI